MQQHASDRRIQDFMTTCRQHQLKITPQRVAIYRALIRSDQHPTADMMFQAVRKEYPSISFDTVNRTLLTFAGIGLVDVVEVFGGPKRFDPDVADHLARMFTVISKRVVLKGLCETCAPER